MPTGRPTGTGRVGRTLRLVATLVALLALPALAPAMPAPAEREAPRHHCGQIRDEMGAALARDDLSGSESLYLAHCAACRGVTGQGQSPAYCPPLVQNAALRPPEDDDDG